MHMGIRRHGGGGGEGHNLWQPPSIQGFSRVLTPIEGKGGGGRDLVVC